MAGPNKTPQNLSPDLKQIYDRVMNTPARGASNNPQGTTQPSILPSNVPPVGSIPTPSPQNNVKPTNNNTPAPSSSPQPSATNPPAQQNADPNPPLPSQPPLEEPAKQPFLTSVQPRPVQPSIGVKSFAVGKEKKDEVKPKESKGEKKGVSKILIIVLAGVFFLAWSFFWVVFFFNPFT